MKLHYGYILQSLDHPSRFYIGFTEDLESRPKHHNSGEVPSTAPYRPRTYRTCTAFSDRGRALAFERYLKTHSGRAFLAKHF